MKVQGRIVPAGQIQISDNQQESIRGLTTEYPYVVHYADFEQAIPWHWHEEVEFGHVIREGIEVMTAERTYVFKENQGYFMNGNVLACMRKSPGAGETVVYTHLFHPVFLGGHFRSIFETKYINPVIHNRNLDLLELKGENTVQKKILSCLRKADFLQKDIDTEFQTRNIFSEVWLLLLEEIRQRPLVPVNLKNQDRVQTMMSFIHQNYAGKIRLEDIAASAAVSTRECLRCFQNTIRKSPAEYLTEYRLDMAKKMLKETDMTITEVSFSAGFSSNAYFGKIFREKCGTTPGKYREESSSLLDKTQGNE